MKKFRVKYKTSVEINQPKTELVVATSTMHAIDQILSSYINFNVNWMLRTLWYT